MPLPSRDDKLGRVEGQGDKAQPDAPSVSYSEAGLPPGEIPETGMRVELDIKHESADTAITYRWVQTEGPQVTIPSLTRRTIEVEIPANCDRLAFVRTASKSGEVRIVRFVIPVRSTAPAPASTPAPVPTSASASATATGPVRADGGDDQVGLVGHRVTLNGSRSTPAEGLVYRWIQVGGPPTLSPQQDRAFYSFIPTNSGLYQFALVVGGRGTVSEADPVSVLVGMAPGGSPGGPAAMPSPAPVSPAATSTVPTPKSIIEAALSRLAEGPRLAGEVSDVFAAVADRTTLYTTFGELQSELSRRLDIVIPTDPSQRLAWSQSVLQPLTLHTIERMMTIGLDVRQPAGLTQPLNSAQRDRLSGHFKALAQDFRDAATSAAQ